MKEARSDDPGGGEGLGALRVGLLGRDPLRLLGLQTIVEAARLKGTGPEGDRTASAVVLSPTHLPERSDCAIVIIDASCTGQLFELMATFRRERPGVRMIVLGESAEPSYVERVIGAGAKGYLTQDAGEREIWMALEIVSDGSVWAPRKVLARLLERPMAANDAPAPQHRVMFTAREVEVLRLLAGGMGNREIAAELGIDESTVKAHLSRLMRKVGAKNRIDLMVKALEQRFTG